VAPSAQERSSEITIAEVLLRYYNGYAKKLESGPQQKLACDLWTRFYGGDATVTDLSPQKQEGFHDFLLGLGHSKSYADKTLSTGRAAFGYALDQQIILSVPRIKCHLTKAEKEAAKPKGRPMTLEEIGRLLNQFHPDAGSGHIVTFMSLMMGTMCRPGAAMSFCSPQIDRRMGAAYLNPVGRVQTKKYRPIVPLTGLTEHAAGATIGNFILFKGKPVTTIKTAWRAGRERAGLDCEVQPYSLRHTMARELIERGVPRYQLALMLGHAVPEGVTSVTYAPVVLRETMEAKACINEIARELERYTKHQLLPDSMAA
jgi:integrase